MIYVILVIAASVVSVGVVVWARRRTLMKDWGEAWDAMDARPQNSLLVFQRFLRFSDSKLRWLGPTVAARTRLGLVVCLLRLGRRERADHELRALKDGPGLSNPDHVLLCRAYLAVPIEALPEDAVVDWAKLLTFPDEDCAVETRSQVQEALRQLLMTGADSSPSEIDLALARIAAVIEIEPVPAWVHYCHGLALAIRGEWQEAVVALEESVELDPHQANVRMALGRAYRELGNLASARSHLEEANRLEPNAQVACEVGTVIVAEAEGMAADDPSRESTLAHAVTLLQQATSEDAALIDAWIGIGRAERLRGHLDEACVVLRRAIVLDDDSAEAHNELGQVLLAQGHREQGRRHVRTACRLDANLFEAIRLAGNLEFEDAKYADALKFYRHLHANDCDDYVVVFRLAKCYLETGKPGRAVNLLKGRPSLDPGATLVLGRALAQQKNWDEALATLECDDPNAMGNEYRYYLACARAANRKLSDAEDLLKSLVDSEEWQERARRQMGHVKLLQGDIEEARGLYASNNGNPDSAFDLGRLELLAGTPEAAKPCFERAARVNNNHRATDFGLAYTLAELGDCGELHALASRGHQAATEELADRAFEEGRYLEATRLHEKSIRKMQHVPTSVLSRLVVAYLQLHRYREALTHLVELHERCPEDEAVRFNLAVCRFHLGRSSFAHAQYEVACRQFAYAEELLREAAPNQADAVLAWQLEAGYREAMSILGSKSRRTSELKRACELFDFGCQKASNLNTGEEVQR